MASGTEKAKATVQAFELWMATQTDETYRQLSYRGSLSRSEITKAIGCGRSALVQNPELRRQLQKLEDQLREHGVLPPLTAQAIARYLFTRTGLTASVLPGWDNLSSRCT
ncbi:VPA1267 family protein, partial [Aeromonas caviae]